MRGAHRRRRLAGWPSTAGAAGTELWVRDISGITAWRWRGRRSTTRLPPFIGKLLKPVCPFIIGILFLLAFPFPFVIVLLPAITITAVPTSGWTSTLGRLSVGLPPWGRGLVTPLSRATTAPRLSLLYLGWGTSVEDAGARSHMERGG